MNTAKVVRGLKQIDALTADQRGKNPEIEKEMREHEKVYVLGDNERVISIDSLKEEIEYPEEEQNISNEKSSDCDVPGILDRLLEVEDIGGLNPLEVKRIDQLRHTNIFDEIAFYIPFHGGFSIPHGIYLNYEKIKSLGISIFGPLGFSDAESFRLMRDAVYDHELFHYVNEHAIAQVELHTGKACYVAANQQNSNGGIGNHLTVVEQEEMMANAFSLKRFLHLRRNSGKAFEALKREMRNQGPGYNLGPTKWNQNWVEDLRVLVQKNMSVIKSFNPIIQEAMDLAGHYKLRPIQASGCPVYVIKGGKLYYLPRKNILRYRGLVKIEVTDNFQRALNKLPKTIQDSWERKSKEYEREITRGHGLHPKRELAKDIWGVMINEDYCVNLKRINPDNWQALEINKI